MFNSLRIRLIALGVAIVAGAMVVSTLINVVTTRRHTLALLDAQRDAVQGEIVSANDRDIAQFQQRRFFTHEDRSRT